MSAKPTDLDERRREIDRIDDALHDLLMRRAEATRAIAEIKALGDKGRASAIRPAREAQILRRLLSRHRGDMPPGIIVRIWREIIAASLQAQAKFHIHVFGGENQGGFSSLAQAYFGTITPMRPHAKASLVVHACAEEPASLGIVPLPDIEERDAPWWLQLAVSGQPGPKIIARLPFLNGAAENHAAAFVLGSVEQEPSGDDTTLLRLEMPAGFSRTRLAALFKEAGFDATLIGATRSGGSGAAGAALVAVAGFVAPSDPRLVVLRKAAGDQIVALDLVGGFANPFTITPPRNCA